MILWMRLNRFLMGKHDDQIDALSMGLDALSRMAGINSDMMNVPIQMSASLNANFKQWDNTFDDDKSGWIKQERMLTTNGVIGESCRTTFRNTKGTTNYELQKSDTRQNDVICDLSQHMNKLTEYKDISDDLTDEQESKLIDYVRVRPK